MSSLLKAALAYAREGFPVFPVTEGDKLPATERGFKDATIDDAQIRAWWAENPNYNIGFSPGSRGWVVVDPDGPEGLAEWQAIVDEAGERVDHSPEASTFTVKTPRGGWHIYFEGTLPKQAKLAQHIDTRTERGYVLLPPSRTAAGSYTIAVEADVQPLPDWVRERVGSTSIKPITLAPDVALDLPVNVERGVSLLRGLGPHREGQGSDDAAYKAAAKLRDLAISPGRAVELMADYFDCDVKDEEWLADKVKHAYGYGQNAPGARAQQPAEEVWGAEVLTKLAKATEGQKPKRSRFWPLSPREMDEEPEPEWLIPNLIPDRSSTWWIGAQKSFKSAVLHDLMLCTAMGCETIFGVKPKRQGHVFYCVLEGRAEHKAWRRAWQLAHNVSVDDLEHYFHVCWAPNLSLDDATREFSQQVELFMQQYPGEEIAMVVIDTQAKVMMGMDEYSSQDAGKYIDWIDRMVEVWKCAVVSVHHMGKDAARGGRGSSAFPAGFATCVIVTRLHEEQSYVTVKVQWHKMAEEPRKPWHFAGVSVPGGALVFQPMSSQEWAAMITGADPFGGPAVAAALTTLQANGSAAGVTSYVLASQLLSRLDGEEPEDWHARCTKASRQLDRLARDRLAGYVKDGVWCLLGEAESEPPP